MKSGREADHSPQSSAEVKNIGIHTSVLPHFPMAYCLVNEAQGQLGCNKKIFRDFPHIAPCAYYERNFVHPTVKAVFFLYIQVPLTLTIVVLQKRCRAHKSNNFPLTINENA
jgi:hypothetical protein